MQTEIKRQYQISCSFMEIYMDTINDLLSNEQSIVEGLQIREDPKKGVYVDGLTEKVFSMHFVRIF